MWIHSTSVPVGWVPLLGAVTSRVRHGESLGLVIVTVATSRVTGAAPLVQAAGRPSPSLPVNTHSDPARNTQTDCREDLTDQIIVCSRETGRQSNQTGGQEGDRHGYREAGRQRPLKK